MFRLMLLSAVVLLAAPVAAEEATAKTRVMKTRTGTTPKGASRVVFETDRAAEYLVVEREDGTGYDVHLLGTDPASLPEGTSITDPRIEGFTFRAGPNGLVAQVTRTGVPTKAKSFALSNPPRVVLDVYPDESARASDNAPNLAKMATAPAPENADRAPQMLDAQPAPPATAKTELAMTSPAPANKEPLTSEGVSAPMASLFTDPDARGTIVRPESDRDFESLVAWIEVLRANVLALDSAPSEEDKSAYRRSLAYRLARRGLVTEAEQILTASLSSRGANPEVSHTDSIFVAELRMSRGDAKGAKDIAEALDPHRGTPLEKVRLANILLETGLSKYAAHLAKDARNGVDGVARARADLVVARAHWDEGQTKLALDVAKRLGRDPNVPEDVRVAGVILEADCLMSMGQWKSAQKRYAKAATMAPRAEEAAWVALQLGNLARREGKTDEAMQRYRETVERYPDTFYATQAEWFLRVAQKVEALREVEASRG